MKNERKRKEMVGTVVSDQMNQTVVVETKTHVAHPRYRKVYVRRTKFSAHDAKRVAGLGDTVRICACRPISKSKNWRVSQVIRKAPLRPDERVARPRRKEVVAEPATTKGAA